MICVEADVAENSTVVVHESGKILHNFRTLNFTGRQISYEDAEPFLSFADKYVSKLTGARELQHYHKLYPMEPVINFMTVSNIAYAILCYENGRDVWMEKLEMRKMSHSERQKYKQKAKLKYHVPRGEKLKAFRDGWTMNGREYYVQLEAEFNEMKRDSVFWNSLREHWNQFLLTNKNDSYIVRTLGLPGSYDEDDDMDENETGVEDAEFDGEIHLPDDSEEEPDC